MNELENEDGVGPLFPAGSKVARENTISEEELTALQDAADEAGLLLPTPFNQSISRIYPGELFTGE
jgi:hypothetical protein